MRSTTCSVAEVESSSSASSALPEIDEQMAALAEIDERILAVWGGAVASWLSITAIAEEAGLQVSSVSERLPAMEDRGLVRHLDMARGDDTVTRWNVSVGGAVLNNHLRKIYQSVDRALASARCV